MTDSQDEKGAVATAEGTHPVPGGESAWTERVDRSMGAILGPPKRIPLLQKVMLKKAERSFKKKLLPGRILARSRELSIATGALEYYVEKGAEKLLSSRIVDMIRIRVSYVVSSPYAIEVNTWDHVGKGIQPTEIEALQGNLPLDDVPSFSSAERLALRYSEALSQTPVRFERALIEALRRAFSENEILAITTLAAKVNFWARLIESWRVSPAGFTNDPALKLDDYRSFIEESDSEGANPGGETGSRSS